MREAAGVIDIERVRRDTPGCTRVIHLNNAGSSLPPEPVVRTEVAYLEREALTGGYELATADQARFDGTYESIARLIGCGVEEIALLDSATTAWQAAFAAIDFEPGDRILTSESAYASNYLTYLLAKQDRGVLVDVAPSGADGSVLVSAMADMVTDRTKLIALTHVPTNGGLVNPAAQVGEVAAEAEVLYLLDACQSVGQLAIDVGDIGCHLLSATGRKFLRAPRGTGFLYVDRDAIDRLHPDRIDLHSADWTGRSTFEWADGARRFETWEFNHAAVRGLGAAVDYALEIGIEAIDWRVRALAGDLRARLWDIDGVIVRDLGVDQCGIVTFDHHRVSAARLRDELGHRRMNVSVTTPSGTLLDAQRRSLPDLVRASVHYFNTDDELDRFAAAVSEIVRTR